MGKNVLSHMLDGGIQNGEIMHSRGIKIPPRPMDSISDADSPIGVQATHNK